MENIYDKGNIAKILKNYNIKETPNRIKVAYELLNSSNHLTINDIHEKLLKKGQRISFTSIYNIVKLFESAGLVKELKTNDKIHYDSNTLPHIHFICEKCQNIWDLNIQENTDWKELLESNLPNYKLGSVEITLHGICENCSKNQNINV
ncbi:Fur family transcriptional regulator [Petrotoga sp. 9PWA.NaAc.5.4]|uniref:Fur family transcriptional regulator n=1 Tax=Petrotoga sp. 9PWA.NaAc.5.4 TaxID=1434328 RepID=UPI000CCAFF40|nr:Fur family transcriptional regulator [Petrotoga sp. 9PWA.NaAc.5.4]PNR94145.1 hypothetical protein X924_06915 [Petrotoga sp. 9PWA.NaAc.5.4]